MNKRTIARIERQEAKNERAAKITAIEKECIRLDKLASTELAKINDIARRVRNGHTIEESDEKMVKMVSNVTDALTGLRAAKIELAALKAPKPAPTEEKA